MAERIPVPSACFFALRRDKRLSAFSCTDTEPLQCAKHGRHTVPNASFWWWVNREGRSLPTVGDHGGRYRDLRGLRLSAGILKTSFLPSAVVKSAP